MNNARRNSFLQLLCLPLFILCTATANAQQTTINFTGIATYVENDWTSFGGVGSTVTGTYTYDLGLTPSLNTTTNNSFLSSHPSNAGLFSWEMTFTLGGLTKTVTQADANFNLSLADASSTGIDRYYASFTGTGSMTGFSGNIDLRDTAAGLNDAITLNGTGNSPPATAPNLSLFDGTTNGRYWERYVDPVTGATTNIYNDLRFNITGVSLATTASAAPVAAVPEPEIYAMMGLGLGLLGWMNRRKKPHGSGAAA